MKNKNTRQESDSSASSSSPDKDSDQLKIFAMSIMDQSSKQGPPTRIFTPSAVEQKDPDEEVNNIICSFVLQHLY